MDHFMLDDNTSSLEEIIAIYAITMDRIESVVAFVEVAERRSFTAAARRLARSPAAVTRAVGELEMRLGVRLLNRTTRAVSLTEAGERFVAGGRGARGAPPGRPRARARAGG